MRLILGRFAEVTIQATENNLWLDVLIAEIHRIFLAKAAMLNSFDVLQYIAF